MVCEKCEKKGKLGKVRITLFRVKDIWFMMLDLEKII